MGRNLACYVCRGRITGYKKEAPAADMRQYVISSVYIVGCGLLNFHLFKHWLTLSSDALNMLFCYIRTFPILPISYPPDIKLLCRAGLLLRRSYIIEVFSTNLIVDHHLSPIYPTNDSLLHNQLRHDLLPLTDP